MNFLISRIHLSKMSHIFMNIVQLYSFLFYYYINQLLLSYLYFANCWYNWIILYQKINRNYRIKFFALFSKKSILNIQDIVKWHVFGGYLKLFYSIIKNKFWYKNISFSIFDLFFLYRIIKNLFNYITSYSELYICWFSLI